MADFTILTSECRNEAASTSFATTAAITPAVGDIAFWHASNSNGAGPALSGGGMTWSLITNASVDKGGGSGFLFAFEAVSGSPTEEVLTFSTTNNTVDPCFAVVRPVDLANPTFVGGAGSSTSVDTLAVPITVDSPAALLAYGAHNSQLQTFAEDAGWTEILDEAVASGRSHQLQERFSDDDEVIIDGSGNGILAGLVLAFEATADVTAPTLSSATGTKTGSTTADLSVSSDEDCDAYVVVTTSETTPSAAQIEAGNDHTGSTAAYSDSELGASAGTINFDGATGLSPSTEYWAHFWAEDAAENSATPVTSDSFTTDAAAASGNPWYHDLNTQLVV